MSCLLAQSDGLVEILLREVVVAVLGEGLRVVSEDVHQLGGPVRRGVWIGFQKGLPLVDGLHEELLRLVLVHPLRAYRAEGVVGDDPDVRVRI